VGVLVTSGKPDDAGRLGTSILKLEQVSVYFTWRTRQDHCATNTTITALFCRRFFLTISSKGEGEGEGEGERERGREGERERGRGR